MRSKKLSLPVRGAWIEIGKFFWWLQERTSLPVRGAWIEIIMVEITDEAAAVAPCEGSVD